MHILSKSSYIKGLQCEKALYLQKKQPYLRDRLSAEQRAKFKRGTEVGVLARSCYPGGIDMTPRNLKDLSQKVEETMLNINNPDVKVMYEAVFQYEDTLIMLDILVRDDVGWQAIEVKSSLSLSETYYNDAALQYYVLKGLKLPITDFKLMYLNRDYVKDGEIDVRQLFKTESVIKDAEARNSFVTSNVARLKDVTNMSSSPLVKIGIQCHRPYDCDFIGHCWKLIPDNSYLYMTAFPDAKLFSYYFEDNYSNAALLRKLEEGSEARAQLEALEANTYYVDFKTLFSMSPTPRSRRIAFLNLLFYRSAVPEIDGYRPYQEILLAFSIHGHKDDEEESFLWNCMDDHRRWEESMQILSQKLSEYDLVVYFSPDSIEVLMRKLCAVNLRNLGHKLFNLYEVLKGASFYHKSIKGGFSLRNVGAALFSGKILFEHEKVLENALSEDQEARQQAMDCLGYENEMIKNIYQKFFR